MRKPWDIPAGSQGCSGVGRQYARRAPRARSRVSGGKLSLGIITLLNVALSLALAIVRRDELLHAVRSQDGEEVRVLLTAKKQTKT